MSIIKGSVLFLLLYSKAVQAEDFTNGFAGATPANADIVPEHVENGIAVCNPEGWARVTNVTATAAGDWLQDSHATFDVTAEACSGLKEQSYVVMVCNQGATAVEGVSVSTIGSLVQELSADCSRTTSDQTVAGYGRFSAESGLQNLTVVLRAPMVDANGTSV